MHNAFHAVHFLGTSWTDSFDFVKSKRICCAPNTAFTCNLIEINECLRSDFKRRHIVLYRLASHLIPDDPNSVGTLIESNQIHTTPSILNTPPTWQNLFSVLQLQLHYALIKASKQTPKSPAYLLEHSISFSNCIKSILQNNNSVLKMCRNKYTRKFINARTSIMDPRGVYVLKIADHATKPSPNNTNGIIRCNSKRYIHETGCIEDLEPDSGHPLYVWRGEHTVFFNFFVFTQHPLVMCN